MTYSFLRCQRAKGIGGPRPCCAKAYRSWRGLRSDYSPLHCRTRTRGASVNKLRERVSQHDYTWRSRGTCLLCRAQREPEQGKADASTNLDRKDLIIVAGGFAMLLAAAFTANREDLADAFYGDGIGSGISTWGGGDILGGILWTVSLYFTSPWQLLLIFLGRVDTERPSDWLLDILGRSTGNDVTDPQYSHSLPIRAAAVLFFAICGTLIAWGFSAALGDATWSVSTGLGSCFISAIYEVGRPDRLSSEEAQKLEDQYSDFAKFADERLQPRGSCHETEIFGAFRKSDPRYRTEEALSDMTLRQFVRNWAKQYVYPAAERTSSGYFKKISLRERVDPFTGEREGAVVPPQSTDGQLAAPDLGPVPANESARP